MDEQFSRAPSDAAPAASDAAPGPLFILGAPRSGTSLVYRALCLHPEASYVSNWVRRFPRLTALAALNRVPSALPGQQLKYWFGEDSNAYRYGDRRALAERLFPAPVEGETVFARAGVREAEEGSPDSPQARAIRRSLNSITALSGARVMVSKRIGHNRRVAFLAAAFPGARFLVLTRDGRAVAYSLSRVNWWEESNAWWYGGRPADWRAAGGDEWALCARAWVEEIRVIESGLAEVAAERVLRVSYEGLVAEPQETLRSIAEFAGLRPNSQWISKLEQVHFPNRNAAWKEALAASAIDVIERCQSRELRALGYA